MPMDTPYISAIERLSTEDGPGLRTVVFFKGCTHRCIWCHNPETLHPGVSILFYGDRCIGCGRCGDHCPHDAIRHTNTAPINRERCQQCGACVRACTTNALNASGTQYAANVLATLLLEDKPYFDNSGGGITFSGGEPLLHMAYLQPVCAALHNQGIHLAVQTAGAFSFSQFEKMLLPYIDMVYFDIKLMDATQHKALTGICNSRILQNFTLLCGHTGVKTVPRTPLIPGVTDTQENLNAIQTFLQSHGISEWHQLEFNPGYTAKWQAAGLKPVAIGID